RRDSSPARLVQPLAAVARPTLEAGQKGCGLLLEKAAPMTSLTDALLLRQREHEIRPLVRRLLDAREPRREEAGARSGRQHDVLPAIDLVRRRNPLRAARQVV